MNDKKLAHSFRKINISDIQERQYSKEGRLGYGKPISEALGRIPDSANLDERHPFDAEVLRIPPKSIPWRYHSHSAQWEFYYVISGDGIVRHAGGRSEVRAGDAFLFKPGDPHQLINESDADLVLMVVADNPIGESYYYPDDAMWIVNSPERRYVVLHPEREKSKSSSDGVSDPG